MKKIHLAILAVFLNVGLYSCTPTSMTEGNPASVTDENQEPQACCGDGGDIPPDED